MDLTWVSPQSVHLLLHLQINTAKPNVYNKYKQGIADQMMPTDGNGNLRPSRALAMRNYYQNNVITNALEVS